VGATALSVRLQVEVPPEGTEVGLQEKLVIDGSDAIVTEAVLETPLAVAVMVTLVLEETEPAVAEKAAPVAPAATVIEAGIVSAVLLSESATTRPPVGAAAVRVTVQEVVPPVVIEVGAQERVLGTISGVTVTEAVLEAPLLVAVTTTAVLEETAPAVARNKALVDPAATVTEAGTVSAALLSESATTRPPVGAAALRVTVQEVVPPVVTEVGAQDRVLGMGSGVTVTEAVLEVPLPVAVTVTTVLAETAPAVAKNEALVDPAGTVTEAGTESAALLSESATAKPPVGAAPVNVAVHVEALFETTDVGEQASWLSVTTGAGDEIEIPLTTLVMGIKLPLIEALRPDN
jgi:hypothetical protein